MLRPGDDLASALIAACEASALAPADGDVLVVAQKIVSKCEGRYVDLATVQPSEQAQRLAAEVDKDPRLVEVILRENHRHGGAPPGRRADRRASAGGSSMANAGVDRSNIDPSAGFRAGLAAAENPDASAATLRARLAAPFPPVARRDRSATVGAAPGAAAQSASRSAPPACRR